MRLTNAAPWTSALRRQPPRGTLPLRCRPPAPGLRTGLGARSAGVPVSSARHAAASAPPSEDSFPSILDTVGGGAQRPASAPSASSTLVRQGVVSSIRLVCRPGHSPAMARGRAASHGIWLVVARSHGIVLVAALARALRAPRPPGHGFDPCRGVGASSAMASPPWSRLCKPFMALGRAAGHGVDLAAVLARLPTALPGQPRCLPGYGVCTRPAAAPCEPFTTRGHAACGGLDLVAAVADPPATA